MDFQQTMAVLAANNIRVANQRGSQVDIYEGGKLVDTQTFTNEDSAKGYALAQYQGRYDTAAFYEGEWQADSKRFIEDELRIEF